MERVSRTEWLMQVAEATARRGTCSRLQVGAIIARDSRIISSGYNGVPARLAHCIHTQPDEPCERAVHAEANAIAFAARMGMATAGCEMYVTHEPCLGCAKLIINSGISAVTWSHSYRIHDGITMLAEAGIILKEETR